MFAFRRSGKVDRKLIFWLALPAFVVIVIAGSRSIAKYQYEHARKLWKDDALVQLSNISMTNEQITTEIDQIKNPIPNLNFGWTHDHVLLMTNGEFLVYAFRHGFNSGFVDHLFLAHGSDGRWYYSTYHFCSHMAGADTDPPGSIAAFASKYAARGFDGRSDACLQHTWP